MATFAPSWANQSDLTGNLVTISQTDAAAVLGQIPAASDAPLVERAIFPTAGTLFVFDYYHAPGSPQGNETFYTVPRIGGSPTLLGAR